MTRTKTTLEDGMEGVSALPTQPREPATSIKTDRQVPTVGRIVHYRLTEANAAFADAQAGRRNVLAAGETCAALVTKVHGADCVDLRIFIGAQDAFQSSVMLGDKEGMWAWPPRA